MGSIAHKCTVRGGSLARSASCETRPGSVWRGIGHRSLAENPQRVGKPLRFELEGLHSARRGDYRVVYVIYQPGEMVTIIAIQHRADVYRPR